MSSGSCCSIPESRLGSVACHPLFVRLVALPHRNIGLVQPFDNVVAVVRSTVAGEHLLGACSGLESLRTNLAGSVLAGKLLNADEGVAARDSPSNESINVPLFQSLEEAFPRWVRKWPECWVAPPLVEIVLLSFLLCSTLERNAKRIVAKD
jgi:hypothetical protein